MAMVRIALKEMTALRKKGEKAAIEHKNLKSECKDIVNDSCSSKEKYLAFKLLETLKYIEELEEIKLDYLRETEQVLLREYRANSLLSAKSEAEQKRLRAILFNRAASLEDPLGIWTERDEKMLAQTESEYYPLCAKLEAIRQ